MPRDLQRYEPAGAHRPDEVGSVLEDRGAARDATLGQVLEDDGRRLEAVLVPSVVIVGHLDQRRVLERGGVLVIVVVDAGFQRERPGHVVSGLVTAARSHLQDQRPRRHPLRGDRGAAIVGRPGQVRLRRADVDPDRCGLHRVVEVECERRARVDLQAVGDSHAAWCRHRQDSRHDVGGECPAASTDAMVAEVGDRSQRHRVDGEVGQRFRRRKRVLGLSRDRLDVAVNCRRDGEGFGDDIDGHRPAECKDHARERWDVLRAVGQVEGDRSRHRVLECEDPAAGGQEHGDDCSQRDPGSADDAARASGALARIGRAGPGLGFLQGRGERQRSARIIPFWSGGAAR